MREGTSAIDQAVAWIENGLTGSLATSFAIIAIASLGYLMLTGRIDFRHAVRVIVGCFIVYGASTISTGIRAALPGAEGQGEAALAASPDTDRGVPALTNIPNVPARSYDPYAGAAIGPRDKSNNLDSGWNSS
jgi:type IV secretory pathway VirB2 component (pilin)